VARAGIWPGYQGDFPLQTGLGRAEAGRCHGGRTHENGRRHGKHAESRRGLAARLRVRKPQRRQQRGQAAAARVRWLPVTAAAAAAAAAAATAAAARAVGAGPAAAAGRRRRLPALRHRAVAAPARFGVSGRRSSCEPDGLTAHAEHCVHNTPQAAQRASPFTT